MSSLIFSLVFGFCVFVNCGFAIDLGNQASNSYAPLNQEEMNVYTDAMQQAINKAQATVDQAAQFATRKDISPTWASKVQLKQAMMMLEVKKTLMNNFKNSPSLRSPLVRRKLLQVLNQDSVTISDLADLQNLVIEEKSKINAMDQETQQQLQQQQQQPPQPAQQLHAQ